MQAFTKNIIFLVLSTLVGFALMWWLYRGFRGEQLLDFFTLRTNYVWMALAIVAGIAANVLRSLRWRMLLSSAGIGISRRRAVELIFISYLVNSVTPRLGELVRCLLLKQGSAEMGSCALGTVVSEKLSDIACLLLLLGVALGLEHRATADLIHAIYAHKPPGLSPLAIRIIGAVCASGAAVLAVMFWRRLRGLLGNLLHGIASIAHLQSVTAYAALCLGIWTCNFLQIYLLAPCFAELSGVGFAGFVHLFAMVSVGALFPTPAGAGPWHFAAVKTLTTVHGVSHQTAKSFALISHGLKTLLVMLLGLLGWAGYNKAVLHKMRRGA